jgi:hypothetical protein
MASRLNGGCAALLVATLADAVGTADEVAGDADDGNVGDML